MSHWNHLLRVAALFAICSLGARSQKSSQPCSDVCGDQRKRIAILPRKIEESPSFLKSALFNNSECEPPQKKWLSEVKTLMRNLGNTPSDNGECPSIDRDYRASDFWLIDNTMEQVKLSGSGDRLPMKSYSKRFEEEKKRCSLASYRGIYNLNKTRPSSDWFLMITTTKQSNSTSLLSEFLSPASNTSLSFRLKSDLHNNCSHTTCKLYTVFRHVKKTSFSSLFVDWKGHNFPGSSIANENLREVMDQNEEPLEDAKPSNIAILCLPLLMSIPPISLLESVSDRTTLWYVLATDVLAVIPILIKGVELLFVNVYGKETIELYQARLGRFTFFEIFESKCSSEVSNKLLLGVGLVATGVWLMLASILAEFTTWRYVRMKKYLALLKDKEDSEISEQASVQSDNFESKMISVSKKEDLSIVRRLALFIVKVFWRGRRKWILILSVGAISSSSLSLIYFSPFLTKMFVFTAGTLTIMILIVATRHIADINNHNFLKGMLAALFAGLLYIGANFNQAFRKPDVWEQFGIGGHFGLSIWVGVGCVIALSQYEILYTYFFQIWAYIIAHLFVLMIRNSTEERKVWKYGTFGTILGVERQVYLQDQPTVKVQFMVLWSIWLQKCGPVVLKMLP